MPYRKGGYDAAEMETYPWEFIRNQGRGKKIFTVDKGRWEGDTIQCLTVGGSSGGALWAGGKGNTNKSEKTVWKHFSGIVPVWTGF